MGTGNTSRDLTYGEPVDANRTGLMCRRVPMDPEEITVRDPPRLLTARLGASQSRFDQEAHLGATIQVWSDHDLNY